MGGQASCCRREKAEEKKRENHWSGNCVIVDQAV
jgi:hypothetical protein